MLCFVVIIILAIMVFVLLIYLLFSALIHRHWGTTREVMLVDMDRINLCLIFESNRLPNIIFIGLYASVLRVPYLLVALPVLAHLCITITMFAQPRKHVSLLDMVP